MSQVASSGPSQARPVKVDFNKPPIAAVSPIARRNHQPSQFSLSLAQDKGEGQKPKTLFEQQTLEPSAKGREAYSGPTSSFLAQSLAQAPDSRPGGPNSLQRSSGTAFYESVRRSIGAPDPKETGKGELLFSGPGTALNLFA